ncbi:uncharacterized protein LOC126554579 [Aphis gossypii]|uniref:uncharacterized protein LOC126554579 n=1 Tax=Aphis gossypii TaxID=80765 RepID=UPI0021598FE9|nr:uncharacterized protein LOC126554579 [Aphis gossypii]
MRSSTSCKKIVHGLLYGNINCKIKAIEYGRVMEPIAKEKYSLIFGSYIKPVGLCVDSNIPYLAASPDGLIGDDEIIEIKCPYSVKDYSNIFEAISDGKIIYCTVDENKEVVLLKKNHDYYFQIQTQLHVTKRKLCHFFIFTDNWYYSIQVKYCEQFWNKNIQPLLLPSVIAPLKGVFDNFLRALRISNALLNIKQNSAVALHPSNNESFVLVKSRASETQVLST